MKKIKKIRWSKRNKKGKLMYIWLNENEVPKDLSYIKDGDKKTLNHLKSKSYILGVY